jgi:CheY-like chemotaxis protein
MLSPNTPGQALRALVVDGYADAADSLVLLLELWGHHARAAYDAPHALDLAQHFHPDVVLTELLLPRGDGFSLAEALGPQAVLVAVTVLSPLRYREQAVVAGFSHYLQKPADLDEVRAILTRMSCYPAATADLVGAGTGSFA